MTTHEEAGFGRSIVFLPPLGGTAAFFADQLAAFAPDHRSIAVTLSGNGDAGPLDTPVHEVMRTHAAEVVRLLEQLGVPRAHLVGVGYGGVVAQQLALEYPQLLRSLTLADTWAELTPNNPADHLIAAALRTAPLAYKLPRSLLIGSTLNNYLRWPAVGQRLAESLREADLAALELQHRAYLRVRYAAALRGINLPSLVLAGDQARHLVGLGRQLAAQIPDARFETIAGSIEPSNLVQPELFNEAVRRFVAPLEIS